MRLQIPSASWLRESERERGEGRGESDGEGIPKRGGVLMGGGNPTFSLDLWMSALYTILPTANYYCPIYCSHKGCVSHWYWQPQLLNCAVLMM